MLDAVMNTWRSLLDWRSFFAPSEIIPQEYRDDSFVTDEERLRERYELMAMNRYQYRSRLLQNSLARYGGDYPDHHH